ncbi:MAG: hypothetical protein WC511_01555 [Candidatus Pacearchaeota archaeon]
MIKKLNVTAQHQFKNKITVEISYMHDESVSPHVAQEDILEHIPEVLGSASITDVRIIQGLLDKNDSLIKTPDKK